MRNKQSKWKKNHSNNSITVGFIWNDKNWGEKKTKKKTVIYIILLQKDIFGGSGGKSARETQTWFSYLKIFDYEIHKIFSFKTKFCLLVRIKINPRIWNGV